MVPGNLLSLCFFIFIVYVQAKDETAKRDKRTVDLFLRGVGDVFGYDVIRRVPSPQILRQVATTPRPTFFPPAVGPLPSGTYSRIILQLQQQQQQQREQEQNNLLLGPVNTNNNNENLVLPQGAIVLPIASLLTAPITSQNLQNSQQLQQQLQPAPQQQSQQQLQPQQQQQQNVGTGILQISTQGIQTQVSRQISSTTAKPESAQIALPWQIVALTPVIGQQQQQQENSLGQQNQAQTAQIPPAPLPTASLTPLGLNVSYDSGPTRLNLLESPRSDTIRRTFNLNLNWNREPSNAAALIQVPIVQTTIAPQQQQLQQQQTPQSAALINQPQSQQIQSQIENFDISPEAINNNNNNNLNLNQNQQFSQLNEPSQRKLNANFRQSIRKFWETSPWNENLRSEDGKEQDNAQNYFDEADNPKTEDIQEEEQQSRETSSEETSNEVRMEEKTTSTFNRAPQKFRRRYTKVKKSVDAIKREKKSSKFVPEDEEKQVKGYYKRFVVSRKTRDIGSKEEFEPMKYTRDEYNRDGYNKDFSFSLPEENKENHELEPEMEKFDVEADIPKKSKIRTKESKSGFNIVKITKNTKVIKE